MHDVVTMVHGGVVSAATPDMTASVRNAGGSGDRRSCNGARDAAHDHPGRPGNGTDGGAGCSASYSFLGRIAACDRQRHQRYCAH